MFRLIRRLFRRRSPKLSRGLSRFFRRGLWIEQRFGAVFAMVPPSRREAIIRHYQTRYGGSRRDAMALAIEDRAADEARWV